MRSDLEQRVIDHLEALGARYEVLDCDPALADTAAFCEHYGYGPEISANAIVIASRRPAGRACVCLGLATTRLDVNRRVKALLGVSKLSFASPEDTIAATGMEIGGVTPFGLPDGLPVYVDARIPALETCIVGGGSRSIKLLLDPEVFTRMPGVEVIDGLAT
jgi:prolyl-tRNA editing enzyme YbaK/EbsC (Cys-tRNA(Pro) deacylase)